MQQEEIRLIDLQFPELINDVVPHVVRSRGDFGRTVYDEGELRGLGRVGERYGHEKLLSRDSRFFDRYSDARFVRVRFRIVQMSTTAQLVNYRPGSKE